MKGLFHRLLAAFLPLGIATSLAGADAADTDMRPDLPLAEALASIRTKPGFRVELVVSEPQIESPVAVDFGPDGKLWVVEMRDYPSGMDGNWKPGGRIKLLQDTTGNGKYDRATVFVDDLPFPTGVMPWRKGALICAAPDIIYAEDTDGDGRADIIKKLFTGFITDNYQARVNGLSLGLDNWIYGANGLRGGLIKSELTGKAADISGRDFRLNPDTGEFEPVAGLTQQSRVRNDAGDWFGCDNSNLLWHYPLDDRYVRRNPHVPAPPPRVLVPGGYDFNQLFPASMTLERFNVPQSANRTTSGCGVGIYRDTLLGQEYYGDAFVCEPVHNLVHRLELEPQGATFKAHRAQDEQRSEFLASTDHWFRPVQARTAPDGSLWIVDMHRFVIEHPRWIPAERLARLDPRGGAEKGRIYRVYREGTKLRTVPRLAELASPQVVEVLNSPNGIQRDLAHTVLIQRADTNAVEPVRRIFSESKSPAGRLQALAVLDGLHGLTAQILLPALADGDSIVRRHAIRLCETKFTKDPSLADAALKLASDPAFRVRYQLALSLGEWADPRATAALGELARADLSDAWMRAAILTSSAGRSADLLKDILTTSPGETGRGEMVGSLIATAAATQAPESFGAVLATISPGRETPVEAWRLVALGSLQDALDRKRVSITSYLGSTNPVVRGAATRIKGLYAGARIIAETEPADLPSREAAIRLLGRGFNNAAADLPVAVAIVKPGAPDRLLQAALEVIRRNTSDEVPPRLLENWPRQSPALRAAIIEVLLGRENWTRQLLAALENNVISPTEISPANRQRLAKSKNDAIVKQAGALFSTQVSENRQAIVARYQSVNSLAGNAPKGAEVFAKNCASCHAMGGQGFEVGPDLRPFKNKPVQDYLVAILDPNSVIEPRFTQYQIDTKDDRSLSGLVANETATSLSLLQPGGTKENILRNDITKIQASRLSLMPEGLESGLTPQDLADLIAWIRSSAQ